MDGIFFLVLAFLTMFSSIRLSYYGDALSKQTKLGSAFIGGLLIASITSLPELITSISAVVLNNPSLSFGDILGSDMFNIFVLSVYNLYFFKKDIFRNTNSKFKYECTILIIEYLLIILGTKTNFLDFSTVTLIIMYILYLIKVIKTSDKENSSEEYIKNPLLIYFIFVNIDSIKYSFNNASRQNITHLSTGFFINYWSYFIRNNYITSRGSIYLCPYKI